MTPGENTATLCRLNRCKREQGVGTWCRIEGLADPVAVCAPHYQVLRDWTGELAAGSQPDPATVVCDECGMRHDAGYLCADREIALMEFAKIRGQQVSRKAEATDA